MTSRLGLVALALCLVAVPALAEDREPEVVRMRFIEHGDDLTVTTKVQKLFDEAAYQALNSGFPSTIVIATAVFPKNERDPIAGRLYKRTVVYDLWDEVYVIRLDEHAKPIKVKFQSEALKILTSLDDLPIAHNADLPPEDIFFLTMTVSLNPVDPKTLAEVQRWLSQGTSGGLDRGGAFFGNFVSVFVHPKIADADSVLVLKSQPFYRPK